MKKLVFALSLLALTPTATRAQDCKLFDLKQGSTLELTSYDAKNNVTGRSVQRVTGISTSGGTTTATFHQQQYDKKDKLSMENDFTVECTGGTLKLDMRAMAAQQDQTQKSMENMQVEVNATKLEMPANPTVGQTLPDGTMTMTAADKNSGMKMFQMTMQFTDRKVEAREKQTTPAGTFDCVKVNQTMKSENVTMSIPIRFEMRSVSWYAPGIGPVRTESYRKEKLMGTTILTKLTR